MYLFICMYCTVQIDKLILIRFSFDSEFGWFPWIQKLNPLAKKQKFAKLVINIFLFTLGTMCFEINNTYFQQEESDFYSFIYSFG